MDRRDLERRRYEGYYQGSSGRLSQFGQDTRDLGDSGGGHQYYGDEARWKNHVRAEHFNNDLYGRGLHERGWDKHLDNYPHQGKTSHFGKGPKGYLRSPERLREDVCEALTRSPEVDARDIDVSVEDGVVTLTGKVLSRKMKKAADRAIDGIPGIEDVINLLSPQGEGLELWSGNDQSI